MNCSIDQSRPSVQALTALIARSPIVTPRQPARLPAGFGDVEVAVLDWIASEGRRIGRCFVLM